MTCNFLFAKKLTSVIIQSSNINLKKIILKFFVLSIALAWNGNHFVLLKGTASVV